MELFRGKYAIFLNCFPIISQNMQKIRVIYTKSDIEVFVSFLIWATFKDSIFLKKKKKKKKKTKKKKKQTFLSKKGLN